VLGLLAMLATGALAGLVNGVCVGVLRMPAFMVTLTLGMFAGGLAVLLVRLAANTETMFNLPRSFVAIGGTPIAAAAMACGASVFAQGLLGSTRYGRMLQAVGYSPRAARASGVPVARVTAGAYVTGGSFAALAAILLTGSLETASPTLGRPFLLDVIGATVIGGTSLSGGRGDVWGTALGVLFLALLVNALTLLNVSDFLITIVKGFVILMAAIIDRTVGGR
jgi:ribose/xylose/arabinose/galactoside ABC-type transport system permease subunit